MIGSRLHRRVVLWLCVSVAFIVAGCHDTPTVTWNSQKLSPNGRWVTVAHSEISGNFGGQYDETVAQVMQAGIEHSGDTVLILSHEYKDIILVMNWDAPNHLRINYRASSRPGDHVNVDFQAIKWGEVTVSATEM